MFNAKFSVLNVHKDAIYNLALSTEHSTLVLIVIFHNNNQTTAFFHLPFLNNHNVKSPTEVSVTKITQNTPM